MAGQGYDRSFYAAGPEGSAGAVLARTSLSCRFQGSSAWGHPLDRLSLRQLVTPEAGTLTIAS